MTEATAPGRIIFSLPGSPGDPTARPVIAPIYSVKYLVP